MDRGLSSLISTLQKFLQSSIFLVLAYSPLPV
jgi:hypothetical protein